MPFLRTRTLFVLVAAAPFLAGCPPCAPAQQGAPPHDPCKELPQMCRALPPSMPNASKLLNHGGPMNNLPGFPNLGTNLNAQQNYVLTFETTTKTIRTLAALGEFEQAHPEAVANAPKPASRQFTSPQEYATFFWTRIPEEAAILRQNGLSPVDLHFTLYALGRAKGAAENAKTPRQIAEYCNNSMSGGGCTLQQVMFVREHYTELETQWNSFASLRSDLSMVWTQPL